MYENVCEILESQYKRIQWFQNNLIIIKSKLFKQSLKTDYISSVWIKFKKNIIVDFYIYFLVSSYSTIANDTEKKL